MGSSSRFRTFEESTIWAVAECSSELFTWKTCFLLAVTTYTRCSDIQSLQLGDGSVQRKGVIFVRFGLSKQDRPNNLGNYIIVSVLTQNKCLGPKRTLTYYLSKTESFRHPDSGEDIVNMFLAGKKPHKPVSSQTISRWLIELIKICYKFGNQTSGKIRGHLTRSVGPSWSFFKGASLQQIMKSADWSRETTFNRYDLKTVNTVCWMCRRHNVINCNSSVKYNLVSRSCGSQFIVLKQLYRNTYTYSCGTMEGT